jgi:hypothetical protein
MDGSPEDLQLLLACARYEVARLRADPRLAAEPPGSRGAGLREHVLDLLGAVEHRAAEQPLADEPISARRAFARHLRQSIMMLQGAHAALPWLAATKMPNVNLGSLYVTEELAQILVGDSVDLVVVPNAEFMYSMTSWPFSEVIDGTEGFEPSTTRRPIVLNYPLTDSDRLLLHPVFAHELGHASVDEHNLVRNLEREMDAAPAFTEALGEVVDVMKAEWPASSPSQIAGTLRAWLRDWTEEILCDLLAVQTMGPAFLWSFASFALPLTYGESGQSHPSNTLRVKLALAHLDDRGWRPYMRSVAPGVTTWLDSIAADASVRLQPVLEFLRDQILAATDLLREAVVRTVGDRALEPTQCIDEAGEAAALIERLVLPVGLETPLQPRSILLGGWQAAIKRHRDEPQGLIAALDDQALQELVGKAIELSTVASSWRTHL